MEPVTTPKQRQREEEADHEQKYEHKHMKHHQKSSLLKMGSMESFLEKQA